MERVISSNRNSKPKINIKNLMEKKISKSVFEVVWFGFNSNGFQIAFESPWEHLELYSYGRLCFGETTGEKP